MKDDILKKSFLAGLFCLLTWNTPAQTGTFLNRLQTPLSPSENRYHSILFDTDMKWSRQLHANPVFYELKNTHSELAPTEEYRSVWATGYSLGDLTGDFLPFEGNSFNDFRVMAAGEYSIRKAGTLYGSAQYARGTHKNIGWNAVRYPELYQPYISTDSIGGDFHFESYAVSGGYSFQLKELFLGFYASFQGEQAHRKSDPRALNNTTWLTFGLGGGRLFNGHLVMIQAGYERNKQHITLRYWRPGQQDRFFVGYGFGLYDVRLSSVAFGYSRMYYINEGHTRVIYQSPADKSLRISAAMGYAYDHMKTEESNIKDLYYSRTHNLHPTFRLEYTPNQALSFTFLLESQTNFRKGYENIFEQYLVDEANNIYDFRLIDTQQKYTYSVSESQAQLKAAYRINPEHTVEVLGGVSYHLRDEKYKEENYRVKNANLYPHAGIGYKMKIKRSEFDWSCLYIRKLQRDNTYEVVMKNQSIEHLDFQHAFSPYAYYSSTYSGINLTSTYVYHLNKTGIGLNLQMMYKKGDREKDVMYTGNIGFDSTAPGIDPLPDRHDEIWGKATLFFVF